MRFPEVSGVDLLRRNVVLPDDLTAELNILLIAFKQWHQRLVNTWIPLAEELEGSGRSVRYYELPTIQSRNVIARVEPPR